MVPPTEAFLAAAEAGEIATAGRATIGRGADPQKKRGPTRGIVVLFAPRGQFLAVAARATSEAPSAFRPDTGFPAMAAAAAAKGINSEDPAKHFGNRAAMRHARFPGAAFRAG